MNSSRERWLLAIFFALAALGFLLPFWPLSLLGIVLAAVARRWISAICIGLLLDLAWGAPVGLAHFLYFPFTILAVASVLIRLWSARYFMDRGRQETL